MKLTTSGVPITVSASIPDYPAFGASWMRIPRVKAVSLFARNRLLAGKA